MLQKNGFLKSDDILDSKIFSGIEKIVVHLTYCLKNCDGDFFVTCKWSMKRKFVKIWWMNHRKTSLNYYLKVKRKNRCNIVYLRGKASVFKIVSAACNTPRFFFTSKFRVPTDNSDTKKWQLSYFTRPFITYIIA